MEADGHSQRSPETQQFIRLIQELGGVLSGCGEIDWWNPQSRGRQIFDDFASHYPDSERLVEAFDGASYFVGGHEHHVIKPPKELDRVYKFTHGDNFGCKSYFSSADPELIGHFHGEANSDPFFYLQRWILLNAVGIHLGNYQTRFEGFVPPERPNWLPRICISQPAIEGPNPTPAEIRRGLSAVGLVEVSSGAFYQKESELLLTDAHPRNVRTVNGLPIPFDAIAEFPTERVRDWCEKQYDRRLNSDQS